MSVKAKFIALLSILSILIVSGLIAYYIMEVNNMVLDISHQEDLDTKNVAHNAYNRFMSDREKELKILKNHKAVKDIYYSLKSADTTLFEADTNRLKLIDSLNNYYALCLGSIDYYDKIWINREKHSVCLTFDTSQNIFTVSSPDTQKYPDSLLLCSAVFDVSDTLTGNMRLLLNSNIVKNLYSPNDLFKEKTTVYLKRFYTKSFIAGGIAILLLFIMTYALSRLFLCRDDKSPKHVVEPELDKLNELQTLLNKKDSQIEALNHTLQSKENLLANFQNALNGILIYNKGKIIFANKSIETITGYTNEELLTKKTNNLYFQKRDSINNDGIYTYQTVAVKKGNSKVRISISEIEINLDSYDIGIAIIKPIEE